MQPSVLIMFFLQLYNKTASYPSSHLHSFITLNLFPRRFPQHIRSQSSGSKHPSHCLIKVDKLLPFFSLNLICANYLLYLIRYFNLISVLPVNDKLAWVELIPHVSVKKLYVDSQATLRTKICSRASKGRAGFSARQSSWRPWCWRAGTMLSTLTVSLSCRVTCKGWKNRAWLLFVPREEFVVDALGYEEWDDAKNRLL